jgi:hypothetical protein
MAWMLYFHWFIFNRTRSGNLWQWSDCFNVDILNFFKLHVNFINSRRHAVTSDNKLLLCNHHSSHKKVYIYKDYKTYEDEISFTSLPYCITVVPCTDKAVVTLPHDVDILNFFKLHVNFINSRRHVMNLLVCFLNVCYLFS